MRPLEPVVVNIYDLVATNRYTYPFGLGVFHSGVEVYGLEFTFGTPSGISLVRPRNAFQENSGPRFRETLHIGYTSLSRRQIRVVIQTMSTREFRWDAYRLVDNNCNHFSEMLLQNLCAKSLPPWVNRLANGLRRFSKLNCPASINDDDRETE